MTMPGALLLVMMTPAEGGDAEYNDWANTEHLPERRRVAGFRTALRFMNKASSPRYLNIYDVDDIAVLRSPAYVAISGKNNSPWTKRILAGATARWRFEGSRIGSVADGSLTGAREPIAELLLIRWRGVPEECDETIVSTLQRTVRNSPGLVQLRVFVGEGGDGFDCVGIAESTQPFGAGFTDPARYAAGSQLCDFAQVFVPLSAT
jgi:hypothetical protein